jgi:hypothetical protein
MRRSPAIGFCGDSFLTTNAAAPGNRFDGDYIAEIKGES